MPDILCRVRIRRNKANYAVIAGNRLNRHRTSEKRCTAPIPAEWHGGTHTRKGFSAKRITRSLVNVADNSLKATVIRTANSAPAPVIYSFTERSLQMGEYDKRLIAYQTAMALARSMRSKGIISAKEYAKIDTIIAEKYGISSCSIFR